MKEPSDLNDLTAGLDIDIKQRDKARRELNMVQITNVEIIENLGQVDLCICDKTGTLTNNVLKLRKIYTDG